MFTKKSVNGTAMTQPLIPWRHWTFDPGLGRMSSIKRVIRRGHGAGSCHLSVAKGLSACCSCYPHAVPASPLSADCARFGFGSRGVSAFDTMKPVTAPMAITGNRSVCPPRSPSRSVTVKGMGKPAHARPAIPADTATPCGMNVKTWEIARPNVPPMKSNGKTGPPSKPEANDVLVRRALTTTNKSSNPTL